MCVCVSMRAMCVLQCVYLFTLFKYILILNMCV